MKAALRLNRYFPGVAVDEFLRSSRLMSLATEVLQEDMPKAPPPPRDEFDPNIEAIKRLREDGLI